MEHVRLGSTGLKVSRACLGTMTFGGQADEATSFAILDRAVELGVTFIDTANTYPSARGADDFGLSEEILGRWLRRHGRQDVVIATKCFGPMGPHPFQRGTSRKAILDAIEGSLRRLGTDYVDLYQLHHHDPETPLEESLGALDDLVRQGKVRYVGCSNFLAYRVGLGLGQSAAHGLCRFASVQSRYNLLFREFERELFPLCEEQGLGVIAWNPLAAGLLTGKHDRSRDPAANTRFAAEGLIGRLYRERYWQREFFDVVDELRQLADEADMPLATLAIAWTVSNPAITAPIIGASHPDQLDATLAGVGAVLDEGLLTRLDELTRPFRMGDHQR